MVSAGSALMRDPFYLMVLATHDDQKLKTSYYSECVGLPEREA